LAVLKVISDEYLAHGVSDRSRNEIGARAGVSQTVVKRAVRLAELDGLISVQRRPRSGRKHLTNIIRIIRAEWLDWLHKGRRKAYAVGACNRAKPIFAEARGVQKNPPRSQVLRNRRSDRVDKSVKKENRTGAGRA
jgi:DNA-binding MarR family transcriptional regulator